MLLIIALHSANAVAVASPATAAIPSAAGRATQMEALWTLEAWKSIAVGAAAASAAIFLSGLALHMLLGKQMGRLMEAEVKRERMRKMDEPHMVVPLAVSPIMYGILISMALVVCKGVIGVGAGGFLNQANALAFTLIFFVGQSAHGLLLDWSTFPVSGSLLILFLVSSIVSTVAGTLAAAAVV
jgi:hypothetical protein